MIAMIGTASSGNDSFGVVRYASVPIRAMMTSSTTIEVELPNGDGAIKPEMVSNMSITRQEVQEAIVVPQDALIRVEDGYVAFVVADRGGVRVAEVRDVILGPTRRNLVVVEEGLSVGEELIVVGQKSVADGDRVNLVGTQGG